MRILHITDYVPGAPVGRDTHLRQFAERSEKLGHQSQIMTGDDLLAGKAPPQSDNWEGHGADVTIIHGRRGWGTAGRLAGKGLCLAWVHDQSFVCPASISWFRKSRTACSRPLGPWCISNAYVEHCNARHPLHNIRNVVAVTNVRRNIGKLDGIIVASQYMRERLIAGGVAGEMVHVLPYFVRVPETIPDTASERPCRILYFGRINEMKGVDVLIEAMALLPAHFELYVAGEGAMVARLRERANQLSLSGERITFDGYLGDPAKVADVFAKAAVVAVPSLWPEPFGIVGLEALARGKPVVASSVGGITEWMKAGEFGYLVPPDSPAELAAKLRELIESPVTRHAMGQKGRDYVRDRFSWERHWNGFEQIVSNLRMAANTAH